MSPSNPIHVRLHAAWRVSEQLRLSRYWWLGSKHGKMLLVDCCDKEVRDRSSLFTSRNQLNIIDFGEEINQLWNVALCPWRLNLTAFVLLRCRPPTPHSPRVIFGVLLISPHSLTTKEAPAGRHPQSTWRALRGAVHVVVIRTTRSLDTVPDWLNYSWYTPLALSVSACVLALGDTDLQMRLILLRMSLVSVVTPSGRLQHLKKCEWTQLTLDTQVKNALLSNLELNTLITSALLSCLFLSVSHTEMMPFHQ